MAYTVLARRYRSQTFGDIVGQDAVAQTLSHAIETERVAHAYLFCGTRGVGKTTMARVLAKSLNCLAIDRPALTPCCKCDSCIAVNTGEDLDVIEIDGASNNGVDNIRELRKNAIYRPARSRFKIYIIDEVHMLSTGAFNALLKILEEPPEHVKFIFATTEPNKVLPTIQSRCQRFDFASISPDIIGMQLKKVLAAESITAKDDLILHLARLANGSMRDALSLLDQLISTGTQPLTVELLEEFLGEPNRAKICSLLDRVGEKDAGEVLNIVDSLLKSGLTCSQIVDSLIDCMRDLMVIASTNGNNNLLLLTDDERKKMTELAGKFDVAALIYCITTLEKLRWTIRNSESARALLEASMLRLALSEHFLGVQNLLSQIKSGNMAAKGRDVKKKVTPAASGNPSAGSPADGAKRNAGFLNISPAQSPNSFSSEPVQESSPKASQVLHGQINLDSIKAGWTGIIKAVTDQQGMLGTILGAGAIAAFDNNCLTIEFQKEFNKVGCEGKAGELTKIISAAVGQKIGLKFEMAVPETLINAPSGKASTASQLQTPQSQQSNAPVSSTRREEILNDPEVRTLISGLGADIINIEMAKE